MVNYRLTFAGVQFSTVCGCAVPIFAAENDSAVLRLFVVSESPAFFSHKPCMRSLCDEQNSPVTKLLLIKCFDLKPAFVYICICS